MSEVIEVCQKALERSEKIMQYRNCIRCRVCPKCGEDLKTEPIDAGEGHMFGVKYTCSNSNCDFQISQGG